MVERRREEYGALNRCSNHRQIDGTGMRGFNNAPPIKMLGLHRKRRVFSLNHSRSCRRMTALKGQAVSSTYLGTRSEANAPTSPSLGASNTACPKRSAWFCSNISRSTPRFGRNARLMSGDPRGLARRCHRKESACKSGGGAEEPRHSHLVRQRPVK
jgi:hypothetical protein